MKKPDKKEFETGKINSGEKTEIYRIAVTGMMLGFALLLGYVESLIPFSIAVPGAKLGLANMAVVLCLFFLGSKYAFVVSVGRIVISSFMFGNAFGLLYSLAGGLFSFFVMYIYKKTAKGEILFTSALGGISHNFAQLCIAYLVVKTPVVFYYIPVLILVGLFTGILNGFIAKLILTRISEFKRMGE